MIKKMSKLQKFLDELENKIINEVRKGELRHQGAKFDYFFDTEKYVVTFNVYADYQDGEDILSLDDFQVIDEDSNDLAYKFPNVIKRLTDHHIDYGWCDEDE